MIAVDWKSPRVKPQGAQDIGYLTANAEMAAAAQAAGLVIDDHAPIAFSFETPIGYRRTRAGSKLEVLYCLGPATRVLTADLRWVPVESLVKGQEVVGFDEKLGRGNAFRRAIVEDTSDFVGEAYRITTDTGEVIASGNHQWVLAKRGAKAGRRWVRTDELRSGDQIAKWHDPWTTEQSYEAGWLAGFLDGEGWISNGGNGSAVGFAQNPGPTLERACRLLGDFGFRTHRTPNKHSRCLGVRIHDGIRAVGMMRPERLIERAHLAWEGQRTWSHRSRHTVVRSVEKIGKHRLIGTKTSTGTLVAEGMLSHNTMWESTDFPEATRPELHLADVVLTPSAFSRDMLAPYTKRPPIVVPLGFDPDVFTPPATDREWKPGESFQWLMVGAPNHRKGWDVIEEIWERTEFGRCDDVHFYGKTVMTSAGITEAVNDGWVMHEQGVLTKGRMVLDPRRLPLPLLAETYRRSHAYLFPTAGEGWGLTLLEAMATGLPCITTRYSGVLDFTTADTVKYVDWKPVYTELGDERRVINSAYADPAHVVAQMHDVMQKYRAAVRMGKRAARDVRQRFTWRQAGAALVRALTDLMAAPHALAA